MSQLDRTHAEVGLIVLGDAIDRPENLALLAEACPAPLHRWFHDQRHRVLALALDAIAAGTVEHDQGAIMGFLSRMRWQDAMDALKGKPVLLAAGSDMADTAMAGASIPSLLSDAAGARALNGMTYGKPGRAIAILKNLAQRRTLMRELEKTGENLAKVGFGEDPSPVLAGMMDILRDNTAPVGERSVGDALNSAIGLAEREAQLRAEGKGRPLSWGVDALDEALSLATGRLVILSGRSGGGKTSLAIQAAHTTSGALGRRSVGLLSLEMTAEELAMILACRDAHVPRAQAEKHWETLLEADRQALKALATKWADDAAMWIRDGAAGRATVETVCQWIRSQKNRHHGALQLVVVDYLGLIQSTNPRASISEHFGSITSSLKQIAMSEGVCILLLAQMTREGRKATRGADGKVAADPEPRNDDLYGGSPVVNDADAIMFLHALPGEVNGVRPVDALVTKNRKGPTSRTPLTFFGPHQHFQLRVEAPNNTEAARERADRIASAPSATEDVF